MSNNSQIHVLTTLLVFFLLHQSVNGCTEEPHCANRASWECFNFNVLRDCKTLCATDKYPNYCATNSKFCATNAWFQENCAKTCCAEVKKTPTSWSFCTKTCGSGTQYKETCNAGVCTREYKACNTGSCVQKYCQNQINRYGIPHACCSVEYQPFYSSCGQSTPNLQVIGGIAAKHKQWPWMVAIDMLLTVRQLCAGTLISNKYVISAAHCFRKEDGTDHDWTKWKLYFGLLKLDGYQSAVTKYIKKIHIHPQFEFPANDIVIIELKTTVKFISTIKPICLPGGEITPQDTTCFVTGWGRSNFFSGGTTDHLQEAGVQNFDLKVCQTKFAKLSHMQTVMPFVNAGSGYLCAGSLHQSIDTCDGDSGGPLVCQRCGSCTYYLAGVTSFGDSGCGQYVPGVYTKVIDYESWIAQVTGVSQSSHFCSNSVGP